MSSLRAVRLLVKLGVVVTRRTPPRRARAARLRIELAAPSRPRQHEVSRRGGRSEVSRWGGRRAELGVQEGGPGSAG